MPTPLELETLLVFAGGIPAHHPDLIDGAHDGATPVLLRNQDTTLDAHGGVIRVLHHNGLASWLSRSYLLGSDGRLSGKEGVIAFAFFAALRVCDCFALRSVRMVGLNSEDETEAQVWFYSSG